MDAHLTDGQRLSAAILAAEVRFPYFTTGFAGLVRRFAPVGTMAISRNGILLVDPQALLDWTAQQAGEVVAHELLHLLRRHAERMDSIPEVDRTVANMATDCVARGTGIAMADGTTKPVEQIQAGDTIIGVQMGKLVTGRVLALLARPRGGVGVELHTYNGILRSTLEHRVLTGDGYARIAEIIAPEARSCKVFRLRPGVHPAVMYDAGDRGNGRAPQAPLHQRPIMDEAEWAIPIAQQREAQERHAFARVVPSRAGLSSRDCRWGGYHHHQAHLQQETRQELLQPIPISEQHQWTLDGMAQAPRILVPSLHQYQWNPMLEDEPRWYPGRRGMQAPATISRYQSATGQAGHQLQGSSGRATIAGQADPADAPDVSGSDALEYAVCQAHRVRIPAGTIYYDLVTTCHSFVADGFAVHNCEINDDLKLENLPESPCLPAKYGLKNGLLAEEYYREILKQSSGAGEPKDGEGQPGTGKADVARGRCGSGSGGEPVEGEPEAAAGAKGRSTADLDRIRRDVAGAIQAHAAQKGRGSVPGGILVWSERELQPPKIRWQDQLRRAMRANVATIAGRVDYTRTRFSRRQGAVGAVARAMGGRAPIMPSLCAPRPRVAFGLDTSGSMGADELRRAVSEAAGCLRALGVPITFLACDAQVHGVPREIKTAAELVANLRGGGGTDFRPLFAAVEALKPRVDLFVFVTDGQGPAPTKAPRGFDTIWVLVGEYASAPCTWGKQITIKD